MMCKIRIEYSAVTLNWMWVLFVVKCKCALVVKLNWIWVYILCPPRRCVSTAQPWLKRPPDKLWTFYPMTSTNLMRYNLQCAYQSINQSIKTNNHLFRERFREKTHWEVNREDTSESHSYLILFSLSIVPDKNAR